MKINICTANRLGLLFFIAMLMGGCGYYPPINVMVIDAETKQPIDGAVLLAQWSKTHGYGLTADVNFKVVEAVSDENGNVQVEGLSAMGVNPPKVAVYKRGYVGWSSQHIFPGFKLRKSFVWREGYVFGLLRFNPEYSHFDHVRFLRNSYTSGVGTGPFEEAWKWESDLAYGGSM